MGGRASGRARARTVLAALAVVATLVAATGQTATAATGVSTCTGTAVRSTISFTSTVVRAQYTERHHRAGGEVEFGKKLSTRNSTKHALTTYYCKAKGTSSWKLWGWSTTPSYGKATVTIKGDKVTDASGPITLAKSVARKSSDAPHDSVKVGAFLCVDAKLTKAMQAQKLAKFATGLPLPLNPLVVVGLWSVSTAIPAVTTPRSCAYEWTTLQFGPDSKGRAVWTSYAKSGETGMSIRTRYGVTQDSGGDGVWVDHYVERYNWKLDGV